MAVNVNRANNNANNNDEVFFSIMSYIGVLAEYQTGWRKEVNIVSWNGNPPKFDVRDWSPDHERMSRGITLHEDEARKLAEHLGNRFRVSASASNNASAGEAKRDINYTSAGGNLRCDGDADFGYESKRPKGGTDGASCVGGESSEAEDCGTETGAGDSEESEDDVSEEDGYEDDVDGEDGPEDNVDGEDGPEDNVDGEDGPEDNANEKGKTEDGARKEEEEFEDEHIA